MNEIAIDWAQFEKHNLLQKISRNFEYFQLGRRASSADFSKQRTRTASILPSVKRDTKKASCSSQKVSIISFYINCPYPMSCKLEMFTSIRLYWWMHWRQATEPVSSSALFQTLLNEPIKRNTWMTSESETLDTHAPSAASNAAIATNQAQPRTAAAQQPATDIDTSDGSIASIADQVDDNIDEIIEEAIDADTESRSSQCVLLQVDGGDSRRHQFEHHRQQGGDSSDKIM